MAKMWVVAGALALLNVAVAMLVFVAPGFATTGEGEAAASTGRLPGVVEAPLPRTQPFWFIAVPRGSQFARRDNRQVEGPASSESASASAGQPSPASGLPAGNAVAPADGVSPGNTTRDAAPRATDLSRRATLPTTPSLLTPLGLYPSGYIGAGMALLSFVTFLALAWVAAFLMPARLMRVQAAIDVAPRRLFVLAVLGVLALALTALVVQVQFMLVVGLVLMPVVVGAAGACLFLGLVAMLLVVGSGVRGRFRLAAVSPLADLAVGLLVVFPFTLIPAIGWIVLGLLGAIGTGAVIATRFGDGTGWSLSSLSEESQ